MKPLTKKKFSSLNINDYINNTNNKGNVITPKKSATTASSTTTQPTSAPTGLSASLYQDYLNQSNANLKSKHEAYLEQQQAYKYANDMLKAQGLANTGQASSAYAGINNRYLDAINEANLAQQQLDTENALQQSAYALEQASNELSTGIDTQEIIDTYGKYLNEQDRLQLDRYIAQAEQIDKNAIFNNYGISEANVAKKFVASNQFYDEYNDIINDKSNNGRVVTFEDINGYYVIYDGKLYAISKDTFNANSQNSLGHIKSRGTKYYNENTRDKG